MALASSNAVLEKEHPTDLAFNSPSVGILSQHFPRPGKCQVLDLGAPASSTVAFFSDSACKFYLEDLYRFFIAPRKDGNFDADGDDELASAIADALSYEDRARFDLVLGWDLFSYMERGAIESLMARVARSCRAGTLLFLTAPTGTMMSSIPARISMTRPERLRYRSAIDSRNIPNPRLSPTAMESMMPGFRLLHSFLLGDEIQEFLFSYS